MNKVFKVIWSEARNAYVVVSEIAKNHGSKSCSTKKLLTMLIATGVMTCASMAPAMAAPNVDASATVNVGKKAAVAVEEQAKVNVKKNAKVNVEEGAELTVKNGAKVTFSKDAGIGFENGAKIKLGSKAGVTLADGAKLSVAKGSNVSVDKNITMGNGAVSSPYVGQTGNVAIGENAKAWNGNGLQEGYMDFGQGGATITPGFFKDNVTIKDGTKLPGSIAIGKNTVARSGSTMIGEHSYNGKIGDTTITPDGNGIMKYNNDVYSTTIGANSFNSGALASVTGVFSIASSKFDGSGGFNTLYAVQNTGSTIYGSMNSIESATGSMYSGIASSVLGFANRTQNANAALIWGTGNEVTNSVENIGIDYNGWNKLSVAEAQQKAIKAMQSSEYAGGSVMAIGGGNKADYAKYSQLTGVQNKVTGTEAKAAKYDFVNGYKNTVTNASDVTVIGIKNEVTADGNKVIGDNHKVSGKNNVIFGSADELTETTVNNAVVLGHNAKVTGAGGVALGAGSVADRAAGMVGYDPTTGAAYDIENGDAPDYVWKATQGAVSVGSGRDTRQITNVAAGSEDTDAVNVAQLKKVNEEALKHSTVTNGDNIAVTETTNKDGGKEYKVALNNDITLEGDNGDIVSISGSKGTIWATGGVTAGSVAAGDVFMDGATATVSGLSNTTTAYDGFATTGKAATEEQLKEVATEAGKHSVVTEGANITVTPEQAADCRMQYKVALNNDITLEGDNAAFVNISGSKGTIWTSGSVAAGNVIMDGTTATVSGLGNTTTAYDGFANGEGKAATEEQLKEISKVADNANQGWNLSTNGDAASKVAPGETVDFSGDKNISVSHDGTKVQVELNKNIDVNYVQTNALNAKYNLSVGTMAENGIMPFFVNSTGDFYAAHNKFSVDKDGKVTATAGEIGNVVLQNGVYYGHSTLQDGSLLLTDDNGNHSYIDAKSAKLGKVTVAEDGKISGVAAGAITADSTDAVNGSQLHAVATEAGKHTTLSNGKNTTVTSTNKDGQVDYQVNVAGDLKDITSVSNGDSKINLNADSISISNGNKSFAITNSGIGMSYIGADYTVKSIMLGENGTTISGGLNVAGSKITGVAAGTADTDAVNVGQLKEAVEAGNTDTHIKPGEYGVGADNKVNMDVVDKNGNKVDTVTIKDVAKASDVGDVNNIANDIKNKEGKTTVVDAVNNLNNKVGDLQYSKVEKGDIADGDSTTTAIGKLDQKLNDVAATAAKHTKVEGSSNITVTNTAKEGEAANYKVELNKDIDVDTVKATTVTTGQTVMNNDGLKVGDKVSVTATAVTAGKTSISDEGVKVGDKTYISDKGLNANGQNITNVADGKVEKDSKDAINGGQLHQAKADINNRIDGVENQVISNTNRINQLGSRVNKVGAGAAALAALHPMDFDPDDKLTFSAGYGNYGGENAAAIGAYYRPDEKVMFSVGGTVGNGENMVNAGVSFSLDRTNHVSNSRTAMAREILDLRAEVTELKAMVAKGGLGSIAEDKMKIFPDVAENHWAYEYVGKLAAAGIIEGYPDGKFSGDRMMSRYEFAAMLYRAMQKGAQLDSKIINEFAPEMGRIRVDRISGEDGDRDKIERVRVNAVKGERDHYGNKIAKAEAKAK